MSESWIIRTIVLVGGNRASTWILSQTGSSGQRSRCKASRSRIPGIGVRGSACTRAGPARCPVRAPGCIEREIQGLLVGEGRVDFLVDGALIVELKAVEMLTIVHVAQVISYLRALDRPLGLLLTFNVKLLRDGVRRVVVS